MKQDKILGRLDDSFRNGRIATVVRDAFELAMTDGLVVAVTSDWVVLHSLADGVYLDDLVMLRLRDISRVWFRDDDAYHHRAIAGLGQTIEVFSCDETAGSAELIEAAEGDAQIIAVHLEKLDELAIGRVMGLRKKSFDLHYVGRDGVWANQLERWKYGDVTRIEVGGRYLEALNKFADPYPEAKEALTRDPATLTDH